MSTVGKHTQPVSGFSPLSFGGCVLWLDATSTSNFALTGSNITAWYDRSPFSNHADRRFNGFPVLSNAVINGRPAVFFSNAPSLDGSMNLTNAGVTGFMVIRPLQTGQSGRVGQRVFSASTPSNNDWNSLDRFFIGFPGYGLARMDYNRNNSPIAQTTVNASNNYVISWTYDSASNYFYMNGADADLAQGLALSNTAFNVSMYGLGNQAVPTTETYEGFIGEVIIYNDYLQPGQRKAVEGYLAWKWGIAPALGATFSPLTSLTNCAVWFDGADATTFTLSGSNITQWRDKAGSNVTTNIGTPVYTSNAINGIPGVLMDVNSGFSISPMTAAANTTTVSIYGIVAASSAVQNNSRIFTSGRTADGDANNDYSATTSWTLYQASAGTPTLTFGHAGAYLYASNRLSNGVPCLISAIFSGTTMSLWANGSNAGSSSTSDTFTFNRLGIGKNTNPNAGNQFDAWAGTVGEFLIFYAAHTEVQRLQVESYLASKWNVQMRAPPHLVPTHPHTIQRPFLRTFLPTDLSSCAFWLDAGDLNTLTLSSSNTVTGWKDKSKDARATTVVSAPSYSATGFNGRPTLQFTSNQYLSSTTATTFGNSYTVFEVAQTVGTGYEISLAIGGTTNPFIYWWRGDFSAYAQLQEGVGGQGNDRYAATNIPMIHSCVVSPSSPYWFYHTNGIKQVNPNLGGYTAAPLSNLGGSNVYVPGTLVQFGGPAGGRFTGNISEVILFSNALTTGERLQVESYLATKWGVRTSFPAVAPHPFKYGPWSGLPASVPGGCTLWLDAGDTSTMSFSGSNVTQWRDKSGNNNHVTAASGGPVFTSSGLVFGTTSVLAGSTPYLHNSVTGEWTAIATFTASGSGAYQQGQPNPRLINYPGIANMIFFETGAFSTYLFSTPNRQISARAVSCNAPYIAVVTNTTSNVAYHVNGTLDTSGTHGTLPTASASNFFVGAGAANGGDRFVGTMNELMVFSNAMTTTQRQQVEGYLAEKWSRRSFLPASHPYLTGPQTPITPASILGCVLWLDAADASAFVLSGNNVTQWIDKSGYGYTTSNLTGTTTLSNNGVVFTGTQALGTNLSYSGSLNTHTMLAVISYSALTGGYLETNATTGTNGSGLDYYITGTGQQAVNAWSSNFQLRGATGLTTGVRSIQEVVYAAGGTSYMYLNGVQTASNATTPSFTTGGFVSLGNWKNGGTYGDGFTGTIHEVLIYSSALTTAQRQQLEGYLAWKWGISSNLAGSAGDWVGLYRPLTAGFDPRSVGACGAWFDAADAGTVQFSSGSNVSRWLDKSGLQNHAVTIAGTPLFTVNTLNGRPVMTFSATQNMRSTYAPATSTTPQTIIAVTRPSALSTWMTPVVIGTTAAGLPPPRTGITTTGYSSYAWFLGATWGGYDGTYATVASTTRTDIVVCTWYGGSNGNTSVNGTQSADSTSTTPALHTKASGGVLTIGATIDNGTNNIWTPYNGYIAEVLVFGKALGVADRQRIEGYLAWKWGLQSQLPALHPYVSTKF